MIYSMYIYIYTGVLSICMCVIKPFYEGPYILVPPHTYILLSHTFIFTLTYIHFHSNSYIFWLTHSCIFILSSFLCFCADSPIERDLRHLLDFENRIPLQWHSFSFQTFYLAVHLNVFADWVTLCRWKTFENKKDSFRNFVSYQNK